MKIDFQYFNKITMLFIYFASYTTLQFYEVTLGNQNMKLR